MKALVTLMVLWYRSTLTELLILFSLLHCYNENWNIALNAMKKLSRMMNYKFLRHCRNWGKTRKPQSEEQVTFSNQESRDYNCKASMPRHPARYIARWNVLSLPLNLPFNTFLRLRKASEFQWISYYYLLIITYIYIPWILQQLLLLTAFYGPLLFMYHHIH